MGKRNRNVEESNDTGESVVDDSLSADLAHAADSVGNDSVAQSSLVKSDVPANIKQFVELSPGVFKRIRVR